MTKNKKYLLVFATWVVVALPALAEDQASCGTNQISPGEALENEIARMAKKATGIEWWSATSAMVDKRKCKEELPSLQKIDNEIFTSRKTDRPINAKINKIDFSSESPELLEAFENLTMQKDVFGKVSGAEDVQKKYQINPGCKKVKCAVEKIFGKELGPKLLYLNVKYGFNGSELAFKNRSRLSLKEVDSLMSAVQTFPATRFPINKNKELSKFKRGYKLAMHEDEVLAYAAITFYDEWSNQSPAMRQYTAFHELGHYMASEMDLDDNQTWLNFSGWVEKKGKWTATKKNSVSSKYGATNPAEDFAEAVTAYRYNPKLLKNLNPEKYQFIKETVFDGLEYLSENQCDISNSNYYKLAQGVVGGNEKTSREEVLELFKRCQMETGEFLMNGARSQEKFDLCMSRAKTIKAATENIDKFLPHLEYPELVKEGLLRQNPAMFSKSSANPELSKQARSILRNEIINGMLKREKLNYFSSFTKSPADICRESWGDNGYIGLFIYDKALLGSLVSADSMEKFENYPVTVCEKIYKNKTGIMPVGKADIEKALGAYP